MLTDSLRSLFVPAMTNVFALLSVRVSSAQSYVQPVPSPTPTSVPSTVMPTRYVAVVAVPVTDAW